jgi:hypothetical protein
VILYEPIYARATIQERDGMSAIKFITSGGMASIGGDLPENEQKVANDIVKSFGEKVRRYALALQVPASLLKVQQCTFLFVAKDTASFHFVFADAPGGAAINYRNLSAQGRLELQSIVHQVRIEVGEVAWAFSSPLNTPAKQFPDLPVSFRQEIHNLVLESYEKAEESKRLLNQAKSRVEQFIEEAVRK